MNSTKDFSALMTAVKANAEKTNKILDRFLTIPQNCNAKRLYESCRYTALAGGKRVRPFLAAEFAAALGKELPDEFAAAIELVHGASLVHDDLPAMDDDDYRRGVLSNHKKFDEATAIIAGDAMFILAFELISGADTDPEIKSKAVFALARLAGMRGMCGGQQIDLDCTGNKEKITASLLCEQDEKKTGALLAASALLGVIAAGGTDEQLKAAESFGMNLGLAFQMKDDLLDVYGNAETVGKATGHDEETGKSTYPAFYGVEKTESLAKEYTDAAINALKAFPENEHISLISDFSDYLLSRRD